MVVGLRRVPAEEHVAVIVHGPDGHARFAQKVTAIAAPRSPERIVDHLDARLGDGLQIDQLGQPLQERRLHVDGFKFFRKGAGNAARRPL